MKCFYAFLAVAAAFTLAFSPAVRRFLFYRDWPQTPDEWQPRYRMWNEGVMVYSGSRDDTEYPPPPEIDPEAFERLR